MISIIDKTQSPDGIPILPHKGFPRTVGTTKEIEIGFTPQGKPAIFEITEWIDQYGLAVDGKYQTLIACY